jgi:hypothetical protein
VVGPAYAAGMTGPSEVDPEVLAGEPASAAQLEGGDDDLPPLRGDADEGPHDAPGGAPGEWAAADALLEGQPTELGELPPA